MPHAYDTAQFTLETHPNLYRKESIQQATATQDPKEQVRRVEKNCFRQSELEVPESVVAENNDVTFCILKNGIKLSTL